MAMYSEGSFCTIGIGLSTRGDMGPSQMAGPHPIIFFKGGAVFFQFALSFSTIWGSSRIVGPNFSWTKRR